MDNYSGTINNRKGKGYALFLAILPIIMAYRFPFMQMGFATVLIAIGIIPAFLILLRRTKTINFVIVSFLSLYLGYVMLKAEGNNFLLPIAVIIHIAAISTGAVNTQKLTDYLEGISLLAAIGVIIQQVVHFILGYHVPMMVPGYLIDELKEYSYNIITGGAEGDTMYRPCAFFLEPAHFSQYVIYGLGSVLFRESKSRWKAIVISLGLLFTTSGMGFVLTFGIWSWWYLNRKKASGKGIIRETIVIGLIVFFVLIIMNHIPFFSQIIARFTNDGSTDYNAIDGRLFFWSKIFEDQSLTSLFFGYGEIALEEDFYYTGFMKILYAYGIIGSFFFYVFLLILLYKVNAFAKTFVLTYWGLSFLANLTGFIPLIFNVGVILTLNSFHIEKNNNIYVSI